jgi:oligopeptide transport system substrate-binding protein
MRLKVLTGLITTLALLGLAACTGTQTSTSNRKVLRLALGDDVKAADPAQANDTISAEVTGHIFEGLLRFAYLGLSGQVEAELAESLPVMKDSDKTLIFRIRSGVSFQDNEAFPNGKGREVTAQDFVYSFKRIGDPKVASPNWWMFDGMVVGFNEWREALSKANDDERQAIFDQDIEGLLAPDPRTLQFKLTRPYPQILQILAMTHASVVAREVVNKYGPEIISHPVGTGAFMLKDWQRGSKITVVRNPKFREVQYPSIGTDEERSAGLLAASGKRLPALDEIQWSIIKEEQPRWLNFMSGQLDKMGIPKDNFGDAIGSDGELTPELSKKGFVLDKSLSMTNWWIEFNLKDPVLGKNRKLRQALAYAFNRSRALELLYNNRGILSSSPITPTIEGGDDVPEAPYTHDLEQAKKLLAEAGFAGGKGLQPLSFDLRGPGTTNRQLGEMLAADFAKIGVQLNVVANSFPEALSKAKEGRFQLMLGGWAADYPDPENFLQLFYGKNAAPGPNSASFVNAEYDQLYEQIRTQRPSASRKKSIRRMVEILHAEVPVVFFFHSMSYGVRRAWLLNHKPNEFLYGTGRYYDLDLALKAKLLK